ncbi:hypothetical protein HZ326_15601 [Fusarium oxysporum f. sp. albedinis]|nr:hypothetical protein HZ326_15601 [Fusarium oxysporum f. sp. albedinis]
MSAAMSLLAGSKLNGNFMHIPPRETSVQAWSWRYFYRLQVSTVISINLNACQFCVPKLRFSWLKPSSETF